MSASSNDKRADNTDDLSVSALALAPERPPALPALPASRKRKDRCIDKHNILDLGSVNLGPQDCASTSLFPETRESARADFLAKRRRFLATPGSANLKHSRPVRMTSGRPPGQAAPFS